MKLVYTTDQMPGYRRLRKGKGFSFRLPDGSRLLDEGERRRILSLAIPPAYDDVWICSLANGHLQATGIDARKRKQYRYHPLWHEGAADRKFEMLASFAAALPKIRASLRRELSDTELTRERVIAGIVALLDLTGYRIGNSRYVRENKTFGISSLLGRHLREEDGHLLMKFRGKAGHEHQAEISHPRLTRLIAELQELPGQHLFRYEDTDGNLHDIGTSDVNAWLKETGGGDYTAKQFRTWRASLLFARQLAVSPPPDSATARERMVREAIKTTAVNLNHTPATCRKYYIHPALITAYRSGELHTVMNSTPPRLSRINGTAKLQADERRVFKLITGAVRRPLRA
ncbi:DNA topoisomerase IB [Luteolibacter yonseiensis]|uniref:DNA topoisomerase n=1 Tax=Luteolibacter yonseiensis TaxID=1144680 RepID=A0A934QX07_9BACT|nr:DNA topoisomerase IB [Luteolibacter yonseiensis]MBK1814278.1 DNA topoisomerase IB [Luteolibacter yonseiensis]